MSLRDQILSANDTPKDVVPMPEWCCKVEIRGISAGDLEDWNWESYSQTTQDTPDGPTRVKRALRSRLLVRCAHDPETGEKLFTLEDVDALNNKPANLIERLYLVCEKLNAVTVADLEELAKNSPPAPALVSE